MDAYTAVKNDEMVVLHYDPDNRQISIEDGPVISVSDARMLFDGALVADCNGAMTTLCLNDYDMDAVEKLNGECEKQRPEGTIPKCLRREEDCLHDIIGAAEDILAEEGTHPYNLFIDRQAFDCVFGILDKIRNDICDERDGVNKRAATA